MARMEKLYVVNVSSIQSFMSCRFRWICAWIENRVPIDDARPLRFGKLFHQIYEWHLRDGMTMQEALNKGKAEWTAKAKSADLDSPDWQVARDALDDLEQVEEPLLLWKDKYTFEIPTLEAEEPFLYVSPLDESIAFRGRPDRVGVYKGRLYHVQNRSLAAGVNFPLYLELSKRSYHEHLYAEAMALKYAVEFQTNDFFYGGTFFNLYRKVKYRKKPTMLQVDRGEPGAVLNSIDKIFWQHPMGIDLHSDLHKHVMKSMIDHVHEMQRVEYEYKEFGTIPPPNEKLNGGPYGNRLDEYYRVLTGEISLDDDRYFKNREDTYAHENAE